MHHCMSFSLCVCYYQCVFLIYTYDSHIWCVFMFRFFIIVSLHMYTFVCDVSISVVDSFTDQFKGACQRM